MDRLTLGARAEIFGAPCRALLCPHCIGLTRDRAEPGSQKGAPQERPRSSGTFPELLEVERDFDRAKLCL